MKTVNANHEQYIHICGADGLGFALWLRAELMRRGSSALFVDCSAGKKLVGYADNAVVSAENWSLSETYAEYTVFYHEQEELYTDLKKGIYLLFACRCNLSYIKKLLEKLTDGALRIFEPVFIPQLGEGSRIGLLVLYGGHVTGEHYIPVGLPEEAPRQCEEMFADIFSESVQPYLSDPSG